MFYVQKLFKYKYLYPQKDFTQKFFTSKFIFKFFYTETF